MEYRVVHQLGTRRVEVVGARIAGQEPDGEGMRPLAELVAEDGDLLLVIFPVCFFLKIQL